MAKGSRGGKRTAGGGVAVNAATQNQTQQPIDQNATSTTSLQNSDVSATLQQFINMSDDDKADLIANMTKDSVPDFLVDNAMQRFSYNLGLNDIPQVVDDASLDAMAGKDMFRTVNAVYNRATDIGYTAPDIVGQIHNSDFTQYSAGGGSAYGRGIYFSDSYRGSTGQYGNNVGQIKSTAVTRCKLNSSAKIINSDTLSSMLTREMRSGSKLGNQLSKMDRASATGIYALSKGYNVISSGKLWSGETYYSILSRNAVTFSSTVKPVSGNGRWK